LAAAGRWTPARERTLRRASLAVGTALALLTGEAALRLASAWSRPAAGRLEQAPDEQAPSVAGDCREQRRQATLAALVRQSTVPDLIYELRPGLETCFQGVRVRTDGEGLRVGGAVAKPRGPGAFRILLLGDSQAFGWGLADGDTLGVRLAEALAAPASPVEVVNAGVPGYNTAQEAAFLRARGSAYRPDCVILLYIGNDLGLPPFLLRPRSALLAGRSLLLARLARFFATGTRAAADPWWDTPSDEDQDLASAAEVPPEYAHLVGLEGYRRALRSLADWAREHGVPVVNVADYGGGGPDWAAVSREQEALGIVHVEPRLPVGSPERRLSESDPHLSPVAVADLARRVAAELGRRRVCLPRS
jgi:lysophospholipase L1-like esterase